MRPISRTALGAAAAAVLAAVTAVGPSAALRHSRSTENWTEAKVSERGGEWTAVVNHAGAAGKPVTLKVELTDSNGASVTQAVARPYDIR
ncbi:MULTISPECIES: hypothetical protein [unclassified Streptomyces]|uniref:hypothetical protein n=1 Tax=unclassified Streptomyces TaxID=2593676 RepID=UPI001BE9A56A|nr:MULTISPECIES: hypothetical protein [unclassified Streptomyces]MBT2405078.1 hypothetical protein [Streptomyces sp. ISL-21]MBT2610804.1 hypothetical protein [Streptomyces sp. ISL-87]